MIVHTVYRPEENIKFLDEWLYHHTQIGVEHFYLYDNMGSVGNMINWSHGANYGTTKYGYRFQVENLEQVLEEEQKITSKYNVTKINWQPKNSKNQTVYGYNESLFHFSEVVSSGLCAFIDIDEFIIKKEDFFPSRMYQKKFKNRSNYQSLADCYEACEIDTSKMDTKVILDMSNLKKILKINRSGYELNMHFQFLTRLPQTKNYYNHYNHNENAHNLLVNEMHGWMFPDKEMAKNIKPYEEIFYKVSDHGLMINRETDSR